MGRFDRINRMIKMSGCVAEEVDAANKLLNHRNICAVHMKSSLSRSGEKLMPYIHEDSERADGTAIRFYSMSAQIEAERKNIIRFWSPVRREPWRSRFG
jgi:hypothetical protein